MKTSILILFSFLFSSIASAQSKEKSYNNLDLSFNFSDLALVPAISYQRYFLLGEKRKFGVGPGLRLYGISSGSDWRFAETNAPEDNFNDGDPNVNAFIADQTRVASLNLGIYFNYRFSDKFEIGLNTDLIGLSFGGSSDGIFTVAETGEVFPVSNIEAESFVLFPVHGSYATEMIWFGYHVGNDFIIRLGFIFADFKYKIEDGIVPGVKENAYERIFNLASLGLSYRF